MSLRRSRNYPHFTKTEVFIYHGNYSILSEMSPFLPSENLPTSVRLVSHVIRVQQK